MWKQWWDIYIYKPQGTTSCQKSEMDPLLNETNAGKLINVPSIHLQKKKKVSCTRLVSLYWHEDLTVLFGTQKYTNVFTVGYLLYILVGMFDRGGKK